MVKVAVCQTESSDSVGENLLKAERIVSENHADLYLFPELFLTRYGNNAYAPEETENTENRLLALCREHDCAMAVGMPSFRNGLHNSLIFFTPEGETVYDKLYLANFAPYNEEIFTAGNRPVIAEWKGMRFGLLICYDVMFPEIHRYYAVHGADAVLMASASAEKSQFAMETVLPARSLENTVYTLFCNNAGTGPAGNYFGGSAVYSPLGKRTVHAGKEEEVILVDLNRKELESARQIRHHLKDLRTDIYWS